MEFGTSLLISTMFGAVGVGYFMVGKKRSHALTMLSGVGLCVFPYFISNGFLMAGIGIVLAAMPWIFGIS